jgi:hypothetical protein
MTWRWALRRPRYPDHRLGVIEPALVYKSVVLGCLKAKFLQKSRTFDWII